MIYDDDFTPSGCTGAAEGGGVIIKAAAASHLLARFFFNCARAICDFRARANPVIF